MKYIGNKKKLLGFIGESLADFGAPCSGRFTDLFSGTTSVAEHFKKSGYAIVSNDFMTYSYVLQKAFIESNSIPNFSKLSNYLGLKKDKTGAHGVLSFLNGLQGSRGYFFENYGHTGSEDRMYFTAENSQIIDSIREQLEVWFKDGLIDSSERFYLLATLINAVDHVANMSGTYGAFLKIWRSVALKRIELKSEPVVDNQKSNLVFQERAEILIERIDGDILYLDPPYNTRQYAPNFHVLESLAVWDKQILSGKTGLRDYSSQKSDFSSRINATDALKIVIEKANYSHIALSYNNEGIIPHDVIFDLFNSIGQCKIYTQDYRRFRTERNHEKRKYKDVDDRTEEFLFVVKKEL